MESLGLLLGPRAALGNTGGTIRTLLYDAKCVSSWRVHAVSKKDNRFTDHASLIGQR